MNKREDRYSNHSSSTSDYIPTSPDLISTRRLSSVGSVTDSLSLFGLSDDLLILADELKFGPEIGKGSFGTVYAGTIINSEGAGTQAVAIKKINCIDLTDEEDRTTFLNEAKQSNLEHSCLIQLIAICAQADVCFLVLELGEGGSLFDFFQKNKDPATLPWSMRLQWAIDMASGLEYLHQEDISIIHRDLKSENVILNGAKDHVKLGDFGLAVTKEKGNSIVNGEACGTINYWATELLSTLALSVSGADKELPFPYSYSSDAYALILILWELTSFTRPFADLKNLTISEKKVKIVDQGYRPAIVSGTIPEYAALFTPGWNNDITKRLDAKTIHEQLMLIKIKSTF